MYCFSPILIMVWYGKATRLPNLFVYMSFVCLFICLLFVCLFLLPLAKLKMVAVTVRANCHLAN